MVEHDKPVEADGQTLLGRSWRSGRSEIPANFVPLCLVLQPNGQTIELDRPDMLVGRHTDADVRLPLPDVSRRHCRCYFQDGEWAVMDLSSLNGIYVNGEKVKQAKLHHRDTLSLGGFSFEVRITSAETVSHSPQNSVGEDGMLQSIANALPPAEERRLAS